MLWLSSIYASLSENSASFASKAMHALTILRSMSESLKFKYAVLPIN